MKTRSSTPLRNTTVDKTATPTPQPRSTTPSLDSAAGRKQAHPPPANPYPTPNHSTSPPRGDSTSLTLLSDTGVDDDDHHLPPPPAPDEGTSKQRSESREAGDVNGMVVLQATGQWVTLLANAITSDPIHTAVMVTKFPPEFYRRLRNKQAVLL